MQILCCVIFFSTLKRLSDSQFDEAFLKNTHNLHSDQKYQFENTFSSEKGMGNLQYDPGIKSRYGSQNSVILIIVVACMLQNILHSDKSTTNYDLNEMVCSIEYHKLLWQV